MAEAQEQEVDYAEYYMVSAGFTVGTTVCQEGDIVAGSDMGFSETNPPLSEEEQEAKYGRVLYEEYEPDEEEKKTLQPRAILGMQASTEPVVVPPPAGQADLTTLSRQQLRQRARTVGLKFPEDTDRDQMIGAIQKKEKEQVEDAAKAAQEDAPEEEEEARG